MTPEKLKLFQHGLGTRPDNYDEVLCTVCGKLSRIIDMDTKPIHIHTGSLAARDGESYHCPNCGNELGVYFWLYS